MVRLLGKKATAIFMELIQGVDYNNPKKLSNSKSFMPVSIEQTGEVKQGKIYSVTHYYEQNGDLVTDPDMTFLVANGCVMPLTFEQGALGIYQVAVQLDKNKYSPRLLSDLVKFANTWMRNIKQQQGLTIAKATKQGIELPK